MGKGRGWITEWKRERNLPSPEEAARMCAILQVAPEEILTEPSDIELVRDKLEEAQETNAKKDPIPKDGALNPVVQEIFDFLDSASVEEIAETVKYIRYLKSQRG